MIIVQFVSPMAKNIERGSPCTPFGFAKLARVRRIGTNLYLRSLIVLVVFFSICITQILMINLILSFRKPHPEVETDANSGMTFLASDCLFRALVEKIEEWRRSAGFRIGSTRWKNSHRNSCCFPARACDWQGKGFVSDAPNQIGSKRTEPAPCSVNFPERAGPCV